MNDLDLDLLSLYHPPDEDYIGFQRTGIMEMLIRNNVLLGDEMGVGKTIQALGVINALKPEFVLIICPNSLRENWRRESLKWIEPTLLESYGDIEFCTSSPFFGGKFIIASFEGLTRWVNTLKKENDWTRGIIIVDEAHGFKSRGIKRTKALYELQDVDCKKIMLSGTPISNYPHELFPLIHWLDREQWPSVSEFEREFGARRAGDFGYNLPKLQDDLRHGKTVTKFKEIKTVKSELRVVGREISFKCNNCSEQWLGDNSQNLATTHVIQTNHHVKRITQNIEELAPGKEVISYERVNEKKVGLMIRRMKKDVMPELPKMRRQIIELPAEGKLLEIVEEEREWFEKNMGLEMELAKLVADAPDDFTYEKFIEELFFNRKYLFEEMSLIRHKLALAKVPYVIEHLQECLENKDKLVCFVHHNDVGRLIRDAFKESSVLVYGATPDHERPALQDRFWNDDSCQLFIGSLKVAKEGLNLQVAAHMVFAEIDWVPGTISQAEGRVHRYGQDMPVLIQHLVAANSMDSSMAKKIVAKQKSITQALNRKVA